MPNPPAPRSRGIPVSEVTWHQILLLVLCAFAFLTNLGGTHLWDEDEAYFGSTVTEMLRRGDHVVPYFNGELSLHKPAFMYWVMMLGTFLFGNGEFAMRIGSVVFSAGTVLLTYHAGRMLFTPRVGLWSGLCLATCLQFMVISRAAVSDPELVFFCTLSMVVFIAALGRCSVDREGLSPARGDATLSWRDWAMCYAAMGAAVLVKGPVGAVLPTAALGLFLLFEHADAVMSDPGRSQAQGHWLKRFLGWVVTALAPMTIARTIWAMRPLTAVCVIAAVAAPWYVWVGMRTNGEWPKGFLLVHNLGRFSQAFEHHAGSPFYYPVAAVVGMFPWSMFLYQSVRGACQKLVGGGQQRRACLFLLANIIVWLGAFSVSSTKLPHYIAPAYPAMAILFGSFVSGWVSRDVEASHAWLRVSWGTLVVVGIAVMAGLGTVLWFLLPDELHLLAIGIVPLLGGIVGMWAHETGRRSVASATVVATALAFPLALLAWAAPQVSVHQNSPHIAAWVRRHAVTPSPHIKSYRFFQESLIYYSGQSVEQCRDPETVVDYFREQSDDAFLVTTRDALSTLRPLLPDDVVPLESMPQFLGKGDVVLLGRSGTTADASQPHERIGSMTSEKELRHE
ncbi:MAG: ArnT family glycosyltransferase [Planctomycetia bacterium]